MGKKINKKKKKRKKLEKIIVEEKIKQNFYKIIPISNKTKIKQKLLNFVSLTIPLIIL